MRILRTLPFRGQFLLTIWSHIGVAIVLLECNQACGQSGSSNFASQAADSSTVVKRLLSGNPGFELGLTPDGKLESDLKMVGYEGIGSSGNFRKSKTLLLKQRLSLLSRDALFSRDVFKVNPTKVAGVSAAALVGLFYLERYQQEAWWRGHTTQFRFVNDAYFAGNFDKLGHCFGAYLQSALAGSAAEWSGFDPQTAGYIGFAFALAQQTYVEVNDGFSRVWGFSPGDMFSNIIGSAYPLLQTAFPSLSHFRPKFGYLPSGAYKSSPWAVRYINDYEGMTLWMSVDVHHYLPAPVKAYWPDFLNLAVGTGLRNYVEQTSWQHTVYISLDINMLKLPGNGPILNTLKTVLNYVHLPLPAVMIYPKVVGLAWKF